MKNSQIYFRKYREQLQRGKLQVPCTHLPKRLKEGSDECWSQILDGCQLRLEAAAEKELWSVHIREASRTFSQHNAVEEQLLDGGQQRTLGEDQVPDLARSPRTEVSQGNRQSFSEDARHKDVVLAHHRQKSRMFREFRQFCIFISIFDLLQCQYGSYL